MYVKLKINGIETTVPKGGTILAAAKAASVYIPTLCHDPRVAPTGACRLCVVEDRRRPGQLIPSCFTPARDGMDIVTDSPVVTAAIREQLKLILINHPLDCPVCDKAGECVLQELVIRYGIVEAPYTLEAPFRPVDRESPLIERDMTRCVLCGRCVRICAELQGKGELEFMRRGYGTYVDTDGSRALDCDFCGLCISACPVGALTDKLFKNTTRPWKLERRETACLHCGLDCRIYLNMEGEILRRVTAPPDKDGAEELLCVRGRFGWRAAAGAVRRPPGPWLRDARGRRDATWEEALDFASRRLAEIAGERGGGAVAVLTADLLTTEEAAVARGFFRTFLGSHDIASLQAAGYRRLMDQLDRMLPSPPPPASQEDLLAADVLLVLGGGAAEWHPVLKPLINRYRQGEGKELIVISSWPDYLFERATLPVAVAPGHLEGFMAELQAALEGREVASGLDASRRGIDVGRLARLVSLLQGQGEIAVLVVPDLYARGDARAALAASLHHRVQRILPLGGQFNSRGALSAGFASPRDFQDILADIEMGRIRSLYLIGEDPLEDFPDPQRVRAALSRLDLLICQAPYATTAAEAAHVFLPTVLPWEKEGSVLAVTGQRRHLRKVMTAPPGARGDGEILEELRRMMGDPPANLPGRVAAVGETGSSGSPAAPPPGSPAATAAGGRGFPEDRTSEANAVGAEAPSPAFPFLLVPVPSLFGDGLVSRQSPELAGLKGGLGVVMNNDDFAALNLKDRETVWVATPYGAAPARVRALARIRPGTALLLHAPGNPEGLSLLRSDVAAVPAAIGRKEAP